MSVQQKIRKLGGFSKFTKYSSLRNSATNEKIKIPYFSQLNTPFKNTAQTKTECMHELF